MIDRMDKICRFTINFHPVRIPFIYIARARLAIEHRPVWVQGCPQGVAEDLVDESRPESGAGCGWVAALRSPKSAHHLRRNPRPAREPTRSRHEPGQSCTVAPTHRTFAE